MASDWLNALSDRAGPFVGAAAAFAPSDALPGADGIQWLAHAIKVHIENAEGEDAERAFLEGSGALLAALLLQHLPSARHARIAERHVLCIGNYGIFDPFRAMEEVLDAASPRKVLAAKLREAEAEAVDKGPVSRVFIAFRDALAEQRPDLHATSHDAFEMTLNDGTRVDLVRVITSTRDSDDPHVATAVRKLVQALPRDGQAALPWETARNDLMPRIVGPRFLQDLQAQTTGQPFTLALAPLIDELSITFVLQGDGRARFVRANELDAWKVSLADARAIAIDNLRDKHAPVKLIQDGPLWFTQSGDGLDSSRILTPDIFEPLLRQLPDARVAIPHRDALLFAPASAQATLETRTKQAFEKAPHPISARVFAFGPSGLLR